MAGIGFELKRVLRKGGLMRFLGVSLASTAVVAGPWLLSVLGIFLVQRLSDLFPMESARMLDHGDAQAGRPGFDKLRRGKPGFARLRRGRLAGQVDQA